MFDTQRVARDFDAASPRYTSASALQQSIGGRLVDMASPYLAADALLIDVGAGSGTVSRLWPTRTFALDIAHGMCTQATALGIPAVTARAEALPVASGSADALSSNLMLQWLARPEEFFAEAQRVLKPGGIFALSTFAEGTLAELQQALGSRRVSEFLGTQRIVGGVQQAGFGILSEAEHSYHEEYDDLRALGNAIRAIGAANKRHDRPRGLTTPKGWREMEMRYVRKNGKLPASWVVHWLVARKK